MHIAIVGAGFSGTLAAYLLEKRGIQVTLYEKEETLGGHCRTLMHKDLFIELGTVFCFCDDIRNLFIELDIPFSERYSYRSFIDGQFDTVEQMTGEQVSTLLKELVQLQTILMHYPNTFGPAHYGMVDVDMDLSLEAFLLKHRLTTIAEAIAPHLSSFGFGHINELPAFYAFSIFDAKTINAFIRSEKLLFMDNGFSEIIQKLCQNISDIRYATEVQHIESIGAKVKIDTQYGTDDYDKVLITTKLPDGVIQDPIYSEWMSKIVTNPFISCAYKVDYKDKVTTYFKAHLGQKEKIQFFHTFKHLHKTVLVAYAYGLVDKVLVNTMMQDIERIGISVKHLISAKQWHMFPHVKAAHLSKTFYSDMIESQKNSPIQLIGSLISKPAIASLYRSIKETVEQVVESATCSDKG
jgi:hypothetical protein